MRLKHIKRSSVILLSFVLAAAITLCSVAAATVLNGTEAENKATPKYYSAVKDWSLENNTADSENVFTYEFAMDSNAPIWDYMSVVNWNEWYTGNTDYTNFADMTEEEWSASFTAADFKNASGISPKGRMRIWNRYGKLDLLDTIPAAALTYRAKYDGYITIPSHTVTVFSNYFTKGYGYRALLRITKNGENIYPESDYIVLDDNTSSQSISETEISVVEGDIIRFEMTSDTPIAQSHSIGVNWNPIIYVRPEKELYTEASGVFGGLTQFMKTVFEGETADTMDSTDALTLAEESSRKSKYGVYTALDSVYEGGVIPSDENSVWKYAAVTVPYGFERPTADYSLNCQREESTLKISWSSEETADLTAVLVETEGKQYTYMAQKGDTYIELPITAEAIFTVQVSDNLGASEIIKSSADGTTVLADSNNGGLIYFNSFEKSGSGASAVYTLSNESVASTYKINYSFDSAKNEAAAENQRAISFSTDKEEQMMFGFTASQKGVYEIAAPIETAEDVNITYGVLKEDVNGIFTAVDEYRKYTEDKSGYSSLLNLKSGETVWFNAVSDSKAEISIGIPRVTLKESTVDTEGNTAYKYRAVDYVESESFNQKEYATGSLTEKSGAVWEFGSFENPIADDSNDTLGYMDYAIGENASELESVLTPYEVIRNGQWYNPLSMVVTATGNISGTYSYGAVGTLHSTLSTAYSASGEHREIGIPYQNKGFMVAVGLGSGKDGKTHNMGIYMKFTAPMSSNVALELSPFADARTACRVLIIKNGAVEKIYTSIPSGTVVDLGYMNKGESVYICYGTDSGKAYSYGGSPIAVLSGDRVSVDFNSSDIYSAETSAYSLTCNDKIELPSVSAKIGKALLGWTDNSGDYYTAGQEYSVAAETSFTADECYYGDINSDGSINITDIAGMRNCFLEDDEYEVSVADITTDGKLDSRDIVRMKKWLAGYAVAFNQK